MVNDLFIGNIVNFACVIHCYLCMYYVAGFYAICFDYELKLSYKVNCSNEFMHNDQDHNYMTLNLNSARIATWKFFLLKFD